MRTIDEREIHNLLLANKDNTRVADELIKRWHLGEVNFQSVNVISYFLIHCKFIPSFINESILSLQKGGWVSWDSILFTVTYVQNLTKTNPKLPKDFFIGLLEGAKNRNQQEFLVRNKQFWNSNKDLENEFFSISEQKQTQLHNEKQELLKKLDLYINENMHEQVEKLLQKLRQKFPSDTNILELDNYYREKNALQAFNQGELKQKQLELLKLEKKWNQLGEEDKLAQTKLVDSFLRMAKKNVAQAYDLSIGLCMMGLAEEALQCLQYCSNDRHVIWLEIELLIQQKYFLKALEKVRDFSSKSESSDDIYAILYYEAICLWGLQRSEEAVAIIENIIKKRPNYRSAQSLFQYWQRMLE